LRFLTLWLLVIVVVLSLGLGAFPLLDPDEGRNAEVGREMALTNDYVMPRLDALPYLDKPIVYFAAAAAAMELLGPTETAARLPALLFTFATAAFVWWFARRLAWTPEEATTAAIVTLATPLTIAFSRTVIFDSALAFFITVAICALYLAIEEREGWNVLAWAAIGLGVITKGPVAILLPLLIAIPYAIKRKRFGALWSWWGLVAFAAVMAPWVWAIHRAVPDFLHYVVVTETAERVATKALKRTGPPWYFVPFLLFGALPWTVVVAESCVVARLRSAAQPRNSATPQLFFALWIIIPFIFFSLSQSKRPQYILPLMPAIALLTARVWSGSPRGRRWAAGVIMFFGAVLVAAPWFVRLRPEYGPAARTSAIVLGAIALVGGAIAMVPRANFALAAITLPVIAMPLAANPVINAVATRRSTAQFVRQLPVGPETEIVGIEAYAGSMSFYLRRPIVVVTPDGDEFTSNYILRHYGRFAGSATLKPPSWLATALTLDDVLFVVRAHDKKHQTLLEQRGLRRVATSARYVAYRD
jgi:4-amino-4-deoxy-L-arabinose transferase-like glycosyltransferase